MFGLTPQVPAIDGVSTIPASVINTWRVVMASAVDGLQGGTYALAPASVLAFPSGGGRWQVDAQFTATYFDAPAATGSGRPGVTATGDGGAYGTVSTGGAANGWGGHFIGGGTTGEGLQATGASNAPGGAAAAGGGNNYGWLGAGHGSGAGLAGVGGATGSGVTGVGGATSGPGGSFFGQAGNSNGCEGTGFGSGAGGYFTGGATSGAGGQFFGGAPNGDAIQATPAGIGAALRANGPIHLSGVPGIVHRTVSISSAPGGNLHADAYDTVWLHNSGAAYDVTLSDPNVGAPGGGPIDEGVRCTFVVPGTEVSAGAAGTYQTKNTGSVNLKDSASGLIAAFAPPAAGTIKAITIETVLVGLIILWDVVGWAVFEA
jgi:hypothetical protein